MKNTAKLIHKKVVSLKEGPFTGTKLVCEVSPCCWMYGSPLQMGVTMLNGSSGSAIVLTGIPYDKATNKDFKAAIEKVRLCKCKTCGKPAFDPKTIETNRAGECEECFLAKLRAEFAILQKKEDAKQKRRDDKMKLKGYKYKMIVCIHAGGDDYFVDVYTVKEPTAVYAAAIAKNRGSRVLNDFRIETL